MSATTLYDVGVSALKSLLACMLVLLVDDDPEEFEIFCEALRVYDRSIKCLHAVDGQEACDILMTPRTVLPDYIFLDINMPVMNGKECLEKIKDEPLLRDIPVIVYTTSSRFSEREMYRSLGARECIVKPTSFSVLVNILRKTLGR